MSQRIIFIIKKWIKDLTAEIIIAICESREEAEKITREYDFKGVFFIYEHKIVEKILDNDERLEIGEWGNYKLFRKDKIIKTISWSKENHHKFSDDHQGTIKDILMLWKCKESTLHCFPRDMIFYLFSLLEESEYEINIRDP